MTEVTETATESPDFDALLAEFENGTKDSQEPASPVATVPGVTTDNPGVTAENASPKTPYRFSKADTDYLVKNFDRFTQYHKDGLLKTHPAQWLGQAISAGDKSATEFFKSLLNGKADREFVRQATFGMGDSLFDLNALLGEKVAEAEKVISERHLETELKDVESAVLAVREKVNAPEAVIEKTLIGLYHTDKRFHEAFDNRNDDKPGWQNALKRVARNMDYELSQLPDPRLTADTEAVVAAVMGARGRDATQDKPRDMKRMSDKEFQGVLKEHGIGF